MRQKGRIALPGFGVMGAAGVVGLLAAGALTAFVILLLSLFLDEWLAALLTGLALAGIAAALALAGKERVEEIGSPLPEQTIETMKEDVEWMKAQARSPGDRGDRGRVGDQVEALSYKTDVGARFDDDVDEKKEAVASTVRGAKSRSRAWWARSSRPSGGCAR